MDLFTIDTRRGRAKRRVSFVNKPVFHSANARSEAGSGGVNNSILHRSVYTRDGLQKCVPREAPCCIVECVCATGRRGVCLEKVVGVSTVIACGNNPVKQSDMLTQAASDHPKRCQWWGCNKCTTKHTKGDSRPKCVKSKRKQTNKRGTKPVNNSTPTRQGGREEAVARVLTVGRRDGAQRVTTLL